MAKEITSKQATENYKRFQASQSYLAEKGLKELVPECVKFMEGKQWAAVTENTKHIPRPVVNFCSKIVNNKLSNILGVPLHLNFRADSDDESTERFTKFASYQMKEMQQDYYDYLACHDGLVKGTYIYYYYWDGNAVGKRGVVEGSLRCETIDLLNFAVANPMETDVQKQKWVLVRTREDVDQVKEECDNAANREAITSDQIESSYESDIEQKENDFVTVYTRFFKKDNEVYFEKSTQYCDIHKPIPLNPKLVEKMLKKKSEVEKEESPLNDAEEYEVDGEVTKNVDSKLEAESEEEYSEKQMKFSVYPFEVGCLEPRDKCIYGISEIENLMENQKAVNFQLSMILLNAQQLGWGKMLVKKDALKGQVINNKPGQVLVDHTPLGTWGIKQLEGTQFNNGAFDIISSIVELSRSVTNSSDIITGDMISKDLSGTAIAQMQAQGQKPIEQMQKRFWRSKERIGKILETYYKLFYENATYSYEISEDEYIAREEAMQKKIMEEHYEGKVPTISKSAQGLFNGMEYEHTPFNIVVEAGKGTQYSEIMQMDFANQLILNGNIDKISSDNMELLLDLYPESAIPNKADLKRFLRKKEQSQVSQLTNKLQEASQLLTQAKEELDSRDSQITKLTTYIKELNNQYGQQINAANTKINNMASFMKNQSLGAEASNTKEVI